MDVINAAKKISEAGTKLDKLTREIAEQVSLSFCTLGTRDLLCVFMSVHECW